MRDVGQLNCRGSYEKWLPQSRRLVKHAVFEFMYYCDDLQLYFILDARLRGHDGLGSR